MYWQNEQVQIYHGDSLEIAKDFGAVDALICDPPYGIKLNTNFNSRGRSCLAKANDYLPVHGDNKPFDPLPWLNYKKVILFGVNYFADKLPPSKKYLIWDKRCGMPSNDQADCELAYCKGIKGSSRIFRHRWQGFIRDSERQTAFHPTQKPVALMQWVVQQAQLKPNSLILDPFMGSGPLALAAIAEGHRYIGIEREQSYCDLAIKRIIENK